MDTNKIYLLAVFSVVFGLAISTISPADKRVENVVSNSDFTTVQAAKVFETPRNTYAQREIVPDF